MKEGESIENGFPDTSQNHYSVHEDYILSVSYNKSNSNIFAVGSGDDTASIWDMNKQQPLFHLKGHGDTVDRVKFNFDGSLLATSSLDSTVRIYDSYSGELRHILEGPSDEIRFIDWH